MPAKEGSFSKREKIGGLVALGAITMGVGAALVTASVGWGLVWFAVIVLAAALCWAMAT